MLDEVSAEQAEERILPRRRLIATALPIAVLALVLVVLCVGALAVGRYQVSFTDVVRILLDRVFPLHHTWSGSQRNVVLLVRLPRILLAALVGAGLSVSGAALQATFRNPLVSPQIIGVSYGASFGGALALLLGLGSAYLVGGAFAFGVAALLVVFLVTATRGPVPVLMIVLAGVVTGSFFNALVSLITYIANPYDQLPAIVFWLLGSVATATYAKVGVAVVPILGGAAVVLLLRWRINVLSLGDDDANALGMHPAPVRWTLLAAVALVVAGSVAVSGVIGWVGLVVPHVARMWVGPDHRVLVPVSLLMGASYLVLIDTLARTLTAAEIPLGVLTAMIGAPVFFVLLRRTKGRVWDDA